MRALEERGWGRPVQQLEAHVGQEENRHSFADYSDEELLQLMDGTS